MSQKTANHENRVRECNDILDTHLKDMQTGFMIRTNSGEFMIRDKKLIKHSYRISSNGDYYGRDFALAEAMRTVDQMYKQGGSDAR